MRVESSALSISWIPDESVQGALRAGFDLGVAHFDAPPPDHIESVDHVRALRDDDAFRFAHALAGWIEVVDGRVIASGVSQESGLIMGATTVRIAPVGATFQAFSLPVLQAEPQLAETSARFVQTVGGRTGVPLPRPVPHPPFVQWRAPTVWTTLALTINADGSSDVDLLGASAFPRHWVYDHAGELILKSGVTDQKSWVSHSFGDRTPWGEQDSAVVVAAAESALERRMSVEIMQGDQRPEIRRLDKGTTVTRQGEPGAELFLLLDGVLAVEVDGKHVGEVGPGAIIGERAIVEQGRRTSTLTATTPVRLAVARADAIDLRNLKEMARQHGWKDPN